MYLSVSQNWEIDQDPVSRYIYFANSTGLIEYNGISARTFTMPYRQGVRSVYVNDDGMVFTGSYEDFGIWEEDTSGRAGLQVTGTGCGSIKE